MGWTGVCPLAAGVDLPLVGRALSLGYIRDGCCLGTSLGSLFPDGWGCDSTWIIVLPRGLSSDARGHIFPKWPPQEKFELMNIPKSLASKVFPPQ